MVVSHISEHTLKQGDSFLLEIQPIGKLHESREILHKTFSREKSSVAMGSDVAELFSEIEKLRVQLLHSVEVAAGVCRRVEEEISQ